MCCRRLPPPGHQLMNFTIQLNPDNESNSQNLHIEWIKSSFEELKKIVEPLIEIMIERKRIESKILSFLTIRKVIVSIVFNISQFFFKFSNS